MQTTINCTKINVVRPERWPDWFDVEIDFVFISAQKNAKKTLPGARLSVMLLGLTLSAFEMLLCCDCFFLLKTLSWVTEDHGVGFSQQDWMLHLKKRKKTFGSDFDRFLRSCRFYSNSSFHPTGGEVSRNTNKCFKARNKTHENTGWESRGIQSISYHNKQQFLLCVTCYSKEYILLAIEQHITGNLHSAQTQESLFVQQHRLPRVSRVKQQSIVCGNKQALHTSLSPFARRVHRTKKKKTKKTGKTPEHRKQQPRDTACLRWTKPDPHPHHSNRPQAHLRLEQATIFLFSLLGTLRAIKPSPPSK